MIKINLVSEGRKPVVARKAKEALGVGDTSLAELLAVGLAVLGILLVAGYWWVLKKEQDANQQAIARAEAEVKELELVLKEVEDFKRKKAELEHKINVINGLKDAQKGPVKIMDQVSDALPELLWLNRMELRGRNVSVSGAAFNTNQVATLIENLNKIPEFKEPRLRETALGRNSIYTFAIGFEFTVPPPEGATDDAAAAAGG